ncbi:type VI secretion system tube protein TssD [Elizabethkingia miricola]|uniref:type VI secretion system tube protein TssD n=1 Tax=Elizabethkingia miricola TaxID=172045 RepID=UPI002ACDCD8C|nr:type VI secretion system tube protein TssD [Elizabethkingia miricola]WQM39422.1 type VI secretion system tube protein TssD [Elizabethkingia miricola]
MSFKVKLKVAGKDYNVLNLNYGLFQETDATGRPSTVTRGGKIDITIESTGATDMFEWMTNSFERKEGNVVFLKRDSDATLKELKFTEAYLIKHKENFNSTGETPLTESFTISARKIEMGTGTYENEWV